MEGVFIYKHITFEATFENSLLNSNGILNIKIGYDEKGNYFSNLLFFDRDKFFVDKTEIINENEIKLFLMSPLKFNVIEPQYEIIFQIIKKITPNKINRSNKHLFKTFLLNKLDDKNKIRKKEKCPCGSGKKYKFCCRYNDKIKQNSYKNHS